MVGQNMSKNTKKDGQLGWKLIMNAVIKVIYIIDVYNIY